MGRDPGWEEQDAAQSERVPSLFSDGQVRQVDGVEGAAQDAP